MKSSSRATRIILATLGLSAVGAVFGGMAAALAVVVWGTILTPLSFGDVSGAMGFASIVGAMLGSVLGPVTAWGLLRRVPLGIAVLGATIGAFVGGSVVALFPAAHPLIGGAVGLVGSSVFLRWRYSKKPSALGAAIDDSALEHRPSQRLEK